MRLLLDEQLPRSLKRLLLGHDVRTVQEQGWASLKNGALLSVAEVDFDVLVTADQSLPHQQNLAEFDIAVVVLVARSNRIEAYEPVADQLRAAIENAPRDRLQVLTAQLGAAADESSP